MRGDPQPPLHAKDRLCLMINHIILQLLSLSIWILLILIVEASERHPCLRWPEPASMQPPGLKYYIWPSWWTPLQYPHLQPAQGQHACWSSAE